MTTYTPTKQTKKYLCVAMVKNSWKKMNLTQRFYAMLAQNKIVKNIYDYLEKIPLVQRLFDVIQKYTWLK